MKSQSDQRVLDRILTLKQEKSVYIIAHYYQVSEIQDIADFVGDSYAMAVAAKNSPLDTILVAGVDFMAESAAILCPGKTVLTPEPGATCPMANAIRVEDIEAYKEQHPDALIVSYVNTPAAIKAVSDVCVTSSNAVKIISKLPKDVPIFFIPDENMGRYVQSQLDRKMDFFPSSCPIHAALTPETIALRKLEHPGAEVMVHPECRPEVIQMADYVGSTAGIIGHACKCTQRELIIGTECGIMHRIEELNPDKKLILADPKLVCADMKKITPEKILYSLEHMETVVTVPEDIRVKAAVALEKMIELAS